MGTQPSQNGDGIRVDSQHGRRPPRKHPRMGRAPRLAAPRQPGRIHALRPGRQPQITHASKPTRKQAGARRLREGKHDVRTDEREATPTHEGGRQVTHGSGPDDTGQPALREAQGGEDLYTAVWALWESLAGTGLSNMTAGAVCHACKTHDLDQLEWALTSIAETGSIRPSSTPAKHPLHCTNCGKECRPHAGTAILCKQCKENLRRRKTKP